MTGMPVPRVPAQLQADPVRGFDRLTRDTGEMQHRLFGRLLMVTATVPDVTRSAAGRAASEVIWVPTVRARSGRRLAGRGRA